MTPTVVSPAEAQAILAPQPGKVTICSVYPHDRARRKFHAAIVRDAKGNLQATSARTYALPAGTRKVPGYLTIYDTFQLKPDYSYEGDQGGVPMIRDGISARAIADQLMKDWAGDLPAVMGVDGGVSTIGIGIIAGDTATIEELDRLQAQQNAYDAATVAEADALYLSEETRKLISKRHRQALEHLGDTDAEAHPWYVKPETGQKKACKACDQPIPFKAIRCPKCNVELDRFCMERGIDCSDDQVLGKSIAMLKKQMEKAKLGG